MKIDEATFKQFRPILSLYLKRGFLISSKDLNGDLDGFLPGEADWILEWFKEEFETYYSQTLKEHIELLNSNINTANLNGTTLNMDKDKLLKQLEEIDLDSDKRLLDCPSCGKLVRMSDINLKRIEHGKLTDCIVYHPKENGVTGHAIMMYLDAQLNVRGKKVIENISFQ